MQSPWPLRSLLFLPAHRIDWVHKVGRTPVDAVILDVEDAVPAERKAQARSLLAEEVTLLREHGIVPIVRINALDAGGDEDLVAVAPKAPSSIMLPKADRPSDVAALAALLLELERRHSLERESIGIIALPETAAGLWFAHEIAAASARVTGLITAVSGKVIGDVARAAGILPTDEGQEQLFLQSRTILASRAAGAMHPLATILPARIDDLDKVRQLMQRARQLGFSGAALIHPSHARIANQVFRPTAEEVSYALGLLDAMADASAKGNAAATYRGAMVDLAMVPHAHDVIASDARFNKRDALFDLDIKQ